MVPRGNVTRLLHGNVRPLGLPLSSPVNEVLMGDRPPQMSSHHHTVTLQETIQHVSLRPAAVDNRGFTRSHRDPVVLPFLSVNTLSLFAKRQKQTKPSSESGTSFHPSPVSCSSKPAAGVPPAMMAGKA